MTAHIIARNTNVAYAQRQTQLFAPPPHTRDFHTEVPLYALHGFRSDNNTAYLHMFHPHTSPPFMRYIHPKMKNQDTHNMILHIFFIETYRSGAGTFLVTHRHLRQ